MWGDRFQVVVSTHLNTEHLHNHFVINSVSFKDGKKYYSNLTNAENFYRVAKAAVNGRESLFLITLDPDGKKVCMTMAELDDDGMTEVIVADDGFIASKDEVGYESYEEDYKGMWEK